MSDLDPREETQIVPTADGEAFIAKSPVPDEDPLAEFKDDRKYRVRHLTPRTALRRLLSRRSRVTPETFGLSPEVKAVMAEFDAEYGSGNRRAVDDLVILLEATLRREGIKPSEVQALVREIVDQTDGPPKESIQHDVNMMAVKVVELPQGAADAL